MEQIFYSAALKSICSIKEFMLLNKKEALIGFQFIYGDGIVYKTVVIIKTVALYNVALSKNCEPYTTVSF